MEFRRSVNRMRGTETASGTADAVVATNQDTMSRQERLNQWKEERNRNVLKQRNDNISSVNQTTNKVVKPLQPAKKVLVINRKSRTTMGPTSFATDKAIRRATTLRRSSEFVGAERVLQKRHETPMANRNRQDDCTPVATRNPLPPSAFTPSRFKLSEEDASLIARTPSSPDEYAVDIVHKLRSEVDRKNAIIAHLEGELNGKSNKTTSEQNMVAALQQELNRLQEMNQQQSKEHQSRMESLEKSIREEYQTKLTSLEQELQLAHKEIQELHQERQQAWPTPETILTPTKPYLKRSSGVMEMVPRAELTDAVYARELAEAKLRDVQAESKELQECVTECATMIEELSGQQQALETAIEERGEQIDALMNRCMVAEFRVNEVDELINERDQLQEQLHKTRKELQHYTNDVHDMSITMDDVAVSTGNKVSVQTQTDRRWNKIQSEMMTLLEENRQLRLTVEKDANTYQQAVTTLTKQRESSETEWKAIMENMVSMRQETMNCLAEKVKRCQELSRQLKEANETIETMKQVMSVDQ
ncbi:hypothetical protein BDF22DRAFT_745130 [Syncephalis plumigaleata]|nr:hypothetical protein BDF22DRAFT_745130 [Syncephalis plumigaleata]